MDAKHAVDFGMAKAILNIHTDTSMTFTITEKEGQAMDISETVKITRTEIRPKVYMISWKEASGTIVMQVHDYDKEKIYSNWITPGGEHQAFEGSLKRHKQE